MTPNYAEWIKAGKHLNFLLANGQQDEIVIYASGPYSFVHSVVVPNKLLSPPDERDLLGWSCNPYHGTASYCTGGGREGTWIELGPHGCGSKTIGEGQDLIFAREFQGWSGPDRVYFEINQEYSHLTEIHWRPEERAYCRYDDNGDLAHVVSTTKGQGSDDVNLVSFAWEPLEEYLAASDSSLVRMFDFTLLRREDFSNWPDGPEQAISNRQDLFYRQKVVPGYAAYTRGIQILACRRPASEVQKSITDGWFGNKDRQHAEFIAQDWRNKRITKISTDPKASTNYFQTEGNDLPFELSPVFFRPEVLLKYKSDRDKYTLEERNISCRNAWFLRGYDVNEAGQVHAYICDLRQLPYSEQLHWLSFNEAPKDIISERAWINDFKGEWTKTTKPLQKVLAILRRWHSQKVEWWTLREERVLNRMTVPYSASKDEWAESFMELAKLVNEGFEVKPIRKKLAGLPVPFEEKDQSLALLEKLGSHIEHAPVSLDGMRTVQRIRSKAKGRAGSTEGEEMARDALAAHETYGAHFESLCDQVAGELLRVGGWFGQDLDLEIE
jgi:hypothetical protein